MNIKIRSGMAAIAPLAVAAFLLSGCSGTDSTPDSTTDDSAQNQPDSSASADSTGTQDSADGDADGGCWVHLFDGDDFDETDDNFKLTEAGKYADLANLPGASQDWTDEADSVKVGPGATVTVWSETDFGGTSQKLDPGSEHPDLDDVLSLEMTCG